jgi:hypothetical protein
MGYTTHKENMVGTQHKAQQSMKYLNNILVKIYVHLKLNERTSI